MICGGAAGAVSTSWRRFKISGNGGGTAPKSTAMSTCSSIQNLHPAPVMSKKWKRYSLVALALGAIVIVSVILASNREPEYEGRPLSEWIYCGEKGSIDKAKEAEVRNAILTMRSNSLPLLAHWISYDSSKDPSYRLI